MDAAQLASMPCPHCGERVSLDGVRFEVRCARCRALVVAEPGAFFAARAPRRAAAVAPAPTPVWGDAVRAGPLAELAARLADIGPPRAADAPRASDDELAFDPARLVSRGVTVELDPLRPLEGDPEGRLSMSQYIAAARAVARIEPLTLRRSLAAHPDPPYGAVRVTLADLGRGACLVALREAPDGRAVIKVVSGSARVDISDDWSGAPWLWQGAHAAPGGRAQRWGVEGLPVARMGPDARGAPLEEWRERCSRGVASAGERAACATVLQDLGRFVEALALYDIELDRDDWARLDRAPIAPSGTFAASAHRGERTLLYALAPWRLRGALASAGTAGRMPRAGVRLALHPHLVVGLAPRGPRGHRLVVTFGPGHHIRPVPPARWARSYEIDLLRFGLVPPEAVPR